jgi:hypothetical protein
MLRMESAVKHCDGKKESPAALLVPSFDPFGGPGHLYVEKVHLAGSLPVM